MKRYLSLILLLLFCSCGTTGFHRQKYTDFGHVKNMRFRESTRQIEQVSVHVTDKLMPRETTGQPFTEQEVRQVPETVADELFPEETPADSLTAGEQVAASDRSPDETIVHQEDEKAKLLDPDVTKRRVRKLSATGYGLFLLDIAAYLVLAGSGSAFVILLLLGLLFLSVCFLFSAHSEGNRYLRAAARGEFAEDRRVRQMSNRALFWGVVFTILLIVGLFGMLLLAGGSYG